MISYNISFVNGQQKHYTRYISFYNRSVSSQCPILRVMQLHLLSQVHLYFNNRAKTNGILCQSIFHPLWKRTRRVS
jgi:hypothetical protein